MPKRRAREDNTIKGWVHIRSAVLGLDDYMCRICFSDSHVAKLHVHHIDYQRSNNKLSNLVTLCDTCHRHIHFEGYKPENHEDWPVPWRVERDADE